MAPVVEGGTKNSKAIKKQVKWPNPVGIRLIEPEIAAPGSERWN